LKTETPRCLARAPAALALLAPAIAAGQKSLIATTTFRGPAADRRAYRAGDVLTVFVAETSRARSQAATDADRNATLGADFDSPTQDYHAQLGTRNRSDNSGETSRTGELRAQITVRVVGVEDNGLMRISGTQSLVINGEQQRITLTGLVRPEDVSATNTVWSSRIADADVAFDGKGVVSQSQKQNWATRVFTWLGIL